MNLTDHHHRFMYAGVTSGPHSNASEVVREGLRLVELRWKEEQARLKRLRGAVREAIEGSERGVSLEFRSADELGGYIDKLRTENLTGRARKRRRV